MGYGGIETAMAHHRKDPTYNADEATWNRLAIVFAVIVVLVIGLVLIFDGIAR